jgi:hypothetical protein
VRTLIFMVAALFVVPALRAQQDETKETPPQPAPQQSAQNSNVRNSLPEAIRPGHPLDPADVEILTGKRDREIDASRSGIPLAVSVYGAYALNGRQGAMLDLPFLPLRRIDYPFFFFGMQARNLGRGFGSGRFR